MPVSCMLSSSSHSSNSPLTFSSVKSYFVGFPWNFFITGNVVKKKLSQEYGANIVLVKWVFVTKVCNEDSLLVYWGLAKLDTPSRTLFWGEICLLIYSYKMFVHTKLPTAPGNIKLGIPNLLESLILTVFQVNKMYDLNPRYE